MRTVLATFLWLLDSLLKFALGFLAVFLVWLPCGVVAGVGFGFGWAIAGGVVGACVNGFFEGCDLFLLGWAKRMAEKRRSAGPCA